MRACIGCISAHAPTHANTPVPSPPPLLCQGKRLLKVNTFLDYAAVARQLVASRISQAGGIVAWGRSAGGLAVAAALPLAPELWRAAILVSERAEADFPVIPQAMQCGCRCGCCLYGAGLCPGVSVNMPSASSAQWLCMKPCTRRMVYYGSSRYTCHGPHMHAQDVPFLEPLSAMCDADLPLTAKERPEWGDPLADQVGAL